MEQKYSEFDYSALYGTQPSAEQGETTEPDGEHSNQQKELQQELERQLHALGQSVSEGFRHGFEGRGQELGDRAVELGGTVLDLVSEGLRRARTEAEQQNAAARNKSNEKERKNAEAQHLQTLRRQRGKRLAWGLGLTIPCGIVAGGLLLGALITLVIWLLTGDPNGLLAAVLCGMVTVPFAWPTLIGIQNLRAAKAFRTYAEIIGERTAVSVQELAAAMQRPVRKLRKELRRYLNKGWLTGWMDETAEMLYLSAEAWQNARAAHQQAVESPEEEQPEQQPVPTEECEVSTQAIERFAQVLGSECSLMDDPLAVEELQRMQRTSLAIGAWVSAHPESAGKARRFVSYYMPTTLKLLHTYNQVKGQQGDNAQSIRRDIGGILHTLNTAFENLHDSLLSDVAMDVSTEIAALQGMLARDGLSVQEL